MLARLAPRTRSPSDRASFSFLLGQPVATLGSDPAAAGSSEVCGRLDLTVAAKRRFAEPQRAVAITTLGWRLRAEVKHHSRSDTMMD
jgi:hypothetical protein